VEKVEQLEMDAHREQLVSDVKGLVEKYRSIAGWDVPDIDQRLSDKLIIVAIRGALDGVESALAGPVQR
jgi:hypothetical protein